MSDAQQNIATEFGFEMGDFPLKELQAGFKNARGMADEFTRASRAVSEGMDLSEMARDMKRVATAVESIDDKLDGLRCMCDCTKDLRSSMPRMSRTVAAVSEEVSGLTQGLRELVGLVGGPDYSVEVETLINPRLLMAGLERDAKKSTDLLTPLARTSRQKGQPL